MAEHHSEDAHFERELEAARKTTERIFAEIGRHVIGQEHLRRRLVTALITQGHVLLEGVPGLAKTLSIKALAGSVHGTFQRIQFTPDLLPGDIIGTEIYRPQSGAFEIRKGPVFANFLLADEINRAPAKVQSALLETMQERQVTIGEQTLPVPRPFFVLATQNPIEQEGTYPLPEAQVDRFMMKVKVDYPSAAEERQMLDTITRKHTGEPPQVAPVATLEDLERLTALSEKIYVDDRVRQYIVNLVGATRKPEDYGLDIAPLIELGASPRAVISLFMATRAEALIEGSQYVVPQMVKDTAADVLRHRILVTYEAEAQGLTADDIVRMILEGVEVP